MTPLYVNGRFAAQTLSGVQRFAVEITACLQALQPGLTVLLPPGSSLAVPAARVVGRRGGQIWEQWELPRHARDGLLINLGNTAPLTARRQLVVIHDAGVFVTPEAYSWKFRAWYKFMHGVLARRRVPIVTISEVSRRDIIRYLPVAPEDVSVIGEGADHMARIAEDPAILAQHELLPGSYVLVTGNLAAHKNLPALGALARQLATRGMRLVITGGLSGAAFQAADRASLPQPALYVGRVSDAALKALYRAAACFVFPSRYEGFGLPAVEAMACGCPVVAAGIAALRETCADAALYADPYAPDSIAAAVGQVLDDAALASRLRGLGRQRADGMTWEGAARALVGVIQGIE